MTDWRARSAVHRQCDERADAAVTTPAHPYIPFNGRLSAAAPTPSWARVVIVFDPDAAIMTTFEATCLLHELGCSRGCSHARQPRRFGTPIITPRGLRVFAYSVNSSAAMATQGYRLPASDSASRSTSMRRLRSASASAEALASRRTPPSIARPMRRPFVAGAHELLCLLVGTDGTSTRSPAMRARVRSAGSAREAASTRSAYPAQRDFAQRHEILLAEEALGRRWWPGPRCRSSPRVAARADRREEDRSARCRRLHRRRDPAASPSGARPWSERRDRSGSRDADVDRGPDSDRSVEQFLYVLPTFRVPWRRLAADEVGVSELVNEENGRPSCQCGVEIEILPHEAPIADGKRGKSFESLQQPFGLDSTVRFDVARRPRRYPTPSCPGRPPAWRTSCRRRPRRQKKRARRPRFARASSALDVSEELIRIRPCFGHQFTGRSCELASHLSWSSAKIELQHH